MYMNITVSEFKLTSNQKVYDVIMLLNFDIAPQGALVAVKLYFTLAFEHSSFSILFSLPSIE